MTCRKCGLHCRHSVLLYNCWFMLLLAGLVNRSHGCLALMKRWSRMADKHLFHCSRLNCYHDPKFQFKNNPINKNEKSFCIVQSIFNCFFSPEKKVRCRHLRVLAVLLSSACTLVCPEEIASVAILHMSCKGKAGMNITEIQCVLWVTDFETFQCLN